MFVTYIWNLHEHLKAYNRIAITSVTQVRGEKHKKNNIPELVCFKTKAFLGQKKFSIVELVFFTYARGEKHKKIIVTSVTQVRGKKHKEISIPELVIFKTRDPRHKRN